MEYDLVKKDDGKDYVKVKTSVLEIDPEITHYYLANLFNGDKRLGK